MLYPKSIWVDFKAKVLYQVYWVKNIAYLPDFNIFIYDSKNLCIIHSQLL